MVLESSMVFLLKRKKYVVEMNSTCLCDFTRIFLNSDYLFLFIFNYVLLHKGYYSEDCYIPLEVGFSLSNTLEAAPLPYTIPLIAC